MIKVVGKTLEGMTVVQGVYSFYETEGLPLDVLFETLRNKGMIPDWPTFVLEAVEARMKVPRILSMLETAVADSYGSDMRDVVLRRLRSMTSEDEAPEATLKLHVLPEEYHQLHSLVDRDTRRSRGAAVDVASLEIFGQALFDRMRGHTVRLVVVREMPDERLAPV